MIKFPDLLKLNKDTDRKFELVGGYSTDSRWETLTWPLGVENSKQPEAGFLYLRKKNIK